MQVSGGQCIGLLDFALDCSCGPLAGFVLSAPASTAACFDLASDCLCCALDSFSSFPEPKPKVTDQFQKNTRNAICWT